LPAGHPTAAFGTFAADLGALFHSVDLFAALCAGFADFSADLADPMGESRTAQHEVAEVWHISAQVIMSGNGRVRHAPRPLPGNGSLLRADMFDGI